MRKFDKLIENLTELVDEGLTFTQVFGNLKKIKTLINGAKKENLDEHDLIELLQVYDIGADPYTMSDIEILEEYKDYITKEMNSEYPHQEK